MQVVWAPTPHIRQAMLAMRAKVCCSAAVRHRRSCEMLCRHRKLASGTGRRTGVEGGQGGGGARLTGKQRHSGAGGRQVRMPAEGAPLSCPFPTREAAQKVAVRNTIVHALINRDFLDFFMNWHKHLQKLKVRRSGFAGHANAGACTLLCPAWTSSSARVNLTWIQQTCSLIDCAGHQPVDRRLRAIHRRLPNRARHRLLRCALHAPAETEQ